MLTLLEYCRWLPSRFCLSHLLMCLRPCGREIDESKGHVCAGLCLKMAERVGDGLLGWASRSFFPGDGTNEGVVAPRTPSVLAAHARAWPLLPMCCLLSLAR